MCGCCDADPLEAMEEIARLEHRRVERLAVEADERAGARQLVGDGRQHRPLVGVARQQVLPRREPAVVLEPAAADEKRLGAGAAAEPGRLEIEEEERRPRRRVRAHERRFVRRLAQTRREIADRRPAVSRARRQRRSTMKQWPYQRPSSSVSRSPSDLMKAGAARGTTSAPDGALMIPRRRSESALTRTSSPSCVSMAAGACSSSRSRILSAAAFASGPVLPIGPTQPGQPLSHSHSAISRRVASSSSPVHAEERLAEADAARVVVVDENPVQARACRARPAYGPASPAPAHPACPLDPIDRDPDVVAIAHEQQLRDLPHRERQPDDAVAPIVGRVRQRAHHRLRDRQPVGRRVHLLLGQIELARPDVFVRVELDLLEPDDPRHHVDFAVRMRDASSSNVSRAVTRV